LVADALATKGEAVEEWVDLHFFRPLGSRLARALSSTRVSADQVTIWSLVVGLVAGHLFVYADPTINFVGFLLFIISDIFDSADGQLARMRGSSTRFGRMLDGLSDNARFVNLYLHICIRLALHGWMWPAALALCVAAGVSHSFQSAAVDFIRHAFLAIGVGRGSELELPEDIPPGKQSLGAWLYALYIRRQATMFPNTVTLIRRMRTGELPAEARAAYRVRVAPLIGHCAWLGQNIRWLLVGATAIPGWPQGMLWIELLPMNVILIALVMSADRAAARVLSGQTQRRPEPVGAH
jgi:hypothetical protein